MYPTFKPKKLALLVALSALASPVFAQTAESSAPEKRLIDEVIVTGRAGVADLKRAEASYAISTLSEEDLLMDHPLSTADVLKSVPGFWVESSGGEASNNIRVRGIPRDGYSSVALEENGLTIQHDGGLGYLNADQSFRLDETIERVEVVRGGPSAIFAANAPGGVVNFITRKPYDNASAIAKAEVGDYGHYRFDGFYGTPVGQDMFVSVGGFYRENDGIRDPGFTSNKGGQLRLSAGKRFEQGEIFADLKMIDDHVAFLLPIPLTFDNSGDVDGIPGFDPNFGAFPGPEVEHNVYRNLSDGYDFDLSDGTHTQLTQFTLSGDITLAGWTLANTFRMRDSDILRNGLFPTGGIETANARLASYSAMLADSLPVGSDLEIRFTNHPDLTFDTANNAGNGLVLNGNLLSVQVPLDETINDFRVSRLFEVGSQTHDLTLGIYYADYDYDFIRYMATAMFEVRDQARLLDVVAVNGGADILNVTDQGILRYGSLYNNVHGTGEALSFYIADEWQITEQLRVDAGIRTESSELGGSVEGTQVVNLGVDGTLADDQFITGNGVFTDIDRSYDNESWTLGVNYQFSDSFGIFGRYTDTFRAPNASDFNGNPERDDLTVEDITMMEGGVKYAGAKFDVFATVFSTVFDGIRFTDYVFDNNTNEFVQRTAFGDTNTFGLELEAFYSPVHWFDIDVVATIQSPEYDSFAFTEIVDGEPQQRDFGGNQLIRVPETALRVVPGLNLINNLLRAELVYEYYSDRYADAANTVELPAYDAISASIRYQVTDNLSLNFNGQNLTNEIGLTEGNPRSGQFISGEAGAQYYLARPILGRNYTASIRYQF